VSDPSAIIDSAEKALEELDKVVPEVYHFLADPTKQPTVKYDSGILADHDKVLAAAVTQIANAAGKGAEEFKDKVTVSWTDGDTVTQEFILARKSGIRSPVHGETTGYSVKIPLEIIVNPATFEVHYDDGAGSGEHKTSTKHVVKSVQINRGAGEVYLWMLRSAAVDISAQPLTKGGETAYKFNLNLSQLVGYFRPDMSDSTDQFTINPDGTITGATGNLEAP
jgi:hypothetical protein